MPRTVFYSITILIIMSLLLGACTAATTPAPKATEPPTKIPAAQAKTVLIGLTVSQTGSLNVESARQVNGLKLWIEQINAAGGLKLADGSAVNFEARLYDDESNKDRVQSLYTKLVNDDKADFLISPYSSGLADAAAAIAEQYGKIMITAGAASDSTYQKGYTRVYQTYTPASRYLTGAFDLLARLDPNAQKVAIIHENDQFSTNVCNAAKAYGETQGYQIVLFEGYDTGAADFAPFINKIPADADAVMGGGHFADGSTLARQLFEKSVKAKFVALLVAPPEPKFAELGGAALGVIGPSQWEPLAKYTAEAAKAARLEWYGPSVADFVAAYKTRYNGEPSYHSAGGYVAGLILQKAIEEAGSVETDQVKAALDGLDILTFYGHVKFETDAKSHGLQIGHEMVYVQWQKDTQGNLVKQVVWPAEGKSADALYPLR